MATSGNEIKGFILAELARNPELFNTAHPPLQQFIEAIAKGVYAGMKKLDDNAGSPPSSGHK